VLRRFVVLFVFLYGLPYPAWSQPPNASLQGQILVGAGDGQAVAVPGVTVELLGTAAAPTVSDGEGRFRFESLPAGVYRVRASLAGFDDAESEMTLGPGETRTIDIRLVVKSLRDEVTVRADAAAMAPAPASEITARTMQRVPMASEQFQAALPLVPGVVRAPDGTLTMKGAREDQSALHVNDASVADPVTGQFAFRLPIEAVRSVEVVTNPYAPEYGQISGAVTRIETAGGSREWKFEVQDVEPRIRRRDGRIHGVESWTPRVAIGGPAGPSMTVFQSMEYQFTKSLVEGLPENEGDTRLESFSTFTQLDWDPGGADRLSIAVAAFPQRLGFVGLSTLNPREVTPDVNQQGHLWTVSERHVVDGQTFVEAHGSVSALNVEAYPSTVGGAMYLGTDQNYGAYFNHRTRDAVRYEGAIKYTSSRTIRGSAHLVKAGAGASRSTFDGMTESRTVMVVRADGTLAEVIAFGEPALIAGGKTEALAFVQDTWTPLDRITIDYGVRYDRDTVAAAHHVAPRAAISFVPRASRRTTIRAGAGLFYDKITLDAATFDQLPWRTVTRYAADGPATSTITARPGIDRLENPASVAWNVELDQQLTPLVDLRVAYQQRDGRQQPIVNPPSPADPVLLLASSGRSLYRELELTGRVRMPHGHWLASYVRSAATGDLNDLPSFIGDLENPIVRPNESSRLPYDAPNRVLAWGEFDLPRGFGVAPLVEVRDGFPVSMFDEHRDFVGTRNAAGRFPTFFSLDVQAWKRITIPWPRRLGARVGLKVFNVTNHFNPRDFWGNTAGTRFGEFSNGVSRTFRGKFVIDF
jgi:hypothetical protein